MQATIPLREQLAIDAEDVIERVGHTLRRQLGEELGRRGLVVGMSGGVDSSVCAGLAVRALGSGRVFGLMMPERDSSPESLEMATEWADRLGIEHRVEEVDPILDAAGCYRRRDEAIRRVVPEYGDGWRCKIGMPSQRLTSDRLNVVMLTVRSPGGELTEHRLGAREYRQIVAATNFKQRVRKMMEYYHADRLHYAVVGTPNRLEYDQGFFVKGGDGLADVKPIAHLYKQQVYQLAEALGVPTAITDRPPTTDTFSLPQEQDEFYFLLPTEDLDLVLLAHNQGMSPEAAAAELDWTADRVARAYREIDRKRSTTQYLHVPPLLSGSVPEIGGSDTGRY